MNDDWLRVTKQKPCEVCGKPDWCLVLKDGSLAICPRTEDGARRNILGSGYLHVLREDRSDARSHRPPKRPNEYKAPPVRFEELAVEYHRTLREEHGRLLDLVKGLKIPWRALEDMRVGWDGSAYTFPMEDGRGAVCGLRRRFPSGMKRSVTGGKDGLFVPRSQDRDRLTCLVVCEGPTDTAAMVSAGFRAVGRPNCNGGHTQLLRYMIRRCTEIVIIFADNDGPGIAGAIKLKGTLKNKNYRAKIVNPKPANDAREWVEMTTMPHDKMERLTRRAT